MSERLQSKKRFSLHFVLFFCIATSSLSACADNKSEDPAFEKVELSLNEELCLSNTYGSQNGLSIPEDSLYLLLGKPNISQDIDVTVELSPIFRSHLVGKANAAMSRGESLIVREATWNIGYCRLTVWLWPDHVNGAVAFSSAQWHRDDLF